MMIRQVMFVCVLAASLGLGCGKKSAEDTERDWHSTQETAQKYAAKYPAAKPVIDDLTKQASADFEEAKKAADDSKASKMQVAVDRLGKPLEEFKTYETELAKLDALATDKDIQNSLSAADFKPLDAQTSAAKKRACCILQPSDKACSDLPGTCPTGQTIANMGDLDAKLDAAVADMKTAEAALAAKKPKPATPAGSAAAGSAKGSGK